MKIDNLIQSCPAYSCKYKILNTECLITPTRCIPADAMHVLSEETRRVRDKYRHVSAEALPCI